MDLTNQVRAYILKMVYESKSGHIGGSFSCAKILSALYEYFDINNCPDGALAYNSDVLILSKGHAAPALYACERVYKNTISDEDLKQFREIDGRLQGHPDKIRFPEAVASTGSLGQGASIACGHALQKKRKGYSGNVFCIIGDGEFQEGQIFEALMFAGKEKLNNLYFILDNNKFQNDGKVVYDLDYYQIAQSFGCRTSQIATSMEDFKNHFIDLMQKASAVDAHKPSFIWCHTQKGEGVSFIEGDPSWHTRIPNEEEYRRALDELGVSI